MELRRIILFSFVLFFGIAEQGIAQFNSWENSPRKDEAENAHVVYTGALEQKDYVMAFDNWKIAYELAPTADGKRHSHFLDGVEIYRHMYTEETDDAKKKEYLANIDRLYSEAVQAYENRDIKPSKCKDDNDAACYNGRIGYVLGRQGYDMFYHLRSPYSKNLEVLDMSIQKSGNDTEYLVFDPLASIVVYQFEKGKLDKTKAVEYYETMEAIAAYNVENNSKYGEYYETAFKAAAAKFQPIEAQIFDCDFFRPKYKAKYDANPDDMDQLKNLVGLLKKRGCPADDPVLKELEGKWKAYAASTNAARKAEFEANNPAILAKKAYDAGDFAGAIAKYDNAINSETDPAKKAGYLFSKASIQGRKLKKYSAARATALEAAKLKPGYGRPYALIGDLYGSGARNCGDSWNQRLAIIAAIDKYRYAKTVDPSMADEMNKRIGKYQASLPDKNEGFMRGVKAGDSQKVGCWIGESVKVKYK